MRHEAVSYVGMSDTCGVACPFVMYVVRCGGGCSERGACGLKARARRHREQSGEIGASRGTPLAEPTLVRYVCRRWHGTRLDAASRM